MSPSTPLSDKDLDHFLRRSAAPLGIRWRKYRRRQSKRGLVGRLRELGLEDDLEAYLQLLAQSAEERDRLIRAMRVTVSRFWRDPEVWEGLRSEVVPALLDGLRPGQPLRVWSCGCASGEEPYSFAILWSCLPADLRAGHRLDIVATDLDESVLERAGRAVYQSSSLRQLPQALREAAFRPTNGELRLRERYREPVHLRRSDLLQDPPPANCHLVLCRYLVFTYFRGGRLTEALDCLLAAIPPGSALVIGSQEDLPPAVSQLQPWPDAPSTYRRVQPQPSA